MKPSKSNMILGSKQRPAKRHALHEEQSAEASASNQNDSVYLPINGGSDYQPSPQPEIDSLSRLYPLRSDTRQPQEDREPERLERRQQSHEASKKSLSAGLALVFNRDNGPKLGRRRLEDSADKLAQAAKEAQDGMLSGRDRLTSTARRRNLEQLMIQQAGKNPGSSQQGPEQNSPTGGVLLKRANNAKVDGQSAKERKDAKKDGQAVKAAAGIVQRFMDSNLVTYTYSCIILVSIFGDDVRRISWLKRWDAVMDIPLIIIMAVFFIEIVFNCAVRRKSYLLSVEIVLDFAATLSILFDIAFIFEEYLAPYEK